MNQMIGNCLSPIPILFVLFLSLRSTDCRLHFCQALKDNNWSVSYSIGVPNGTFHHKFVVIKDYYWKLVFTQDVGQQNSVRSGDKIAAKKGVLSFEDVFGKQSNFLSGDYHLAFGAKNGLKDGGAGDWTETLLAAKGSAHYSVISRNSPDLPQSDSKKSDIVIKGSPLTDPELAFVPFSGSQSDGKVVIVEQRWTGKPKYEAKFWNYNLWAPNQVESADKSSVPSAVEKALTFYKVKGLFGVSLSNTDADNKDGVIFLIEWCDTSADTPTTDGQCNGQVVYLYCVTSQNDIDPMRQNCFPALVTQQKLIDCSDESQWIDTQTGGAVVRVDSSDGDSNQTDDQIEDNFDPSKDKPDEPDTGKGSGIWIVIAIVCVVLIIIFVILMAIFCWKKQQPQEKSAENAPKSASTVHSEKGSKGSAVGVSKSGSGPEKPVNEVSPAVKSVRSDSDKADKHKVKPKTEPQVQRQQSPENVSLAMKSVRSRLE